MTVTPSPNAGMLRRYLAALESGVVGPELAAFFRADAVQVELPNRLNAKGQRSDLASLLARAEQGRGLLQHQRYEVRSIVEEGDRVAVEALWSAVLAVPLGALAAGSTMRAHFAMFFELSDGLIVAQRNYDCFEAW